MNHSTDLVEEHDSDDVDTPTPAASSSQRSRSAAWRCVCVPCMTLRRVQPRALRGRKRVLLISASFITLLSLYYVYVLPALWHCSEYFTLMLLLGILEGLLLFFATIWHAYQSQVTKRRARRASPLSRASDDDYSETSGDYLDSEGASSAVELSDAVPDSLRSPPPPPAAALLRNETAAVSVFQSQQQQQHAQHQDQLQHHQLQEEQLRDIDLNRSAEDEFDSDAQLPRHATRKLPRRSSQRRVSSDFDSDYQDEGDNEDDDDDDVAPARSNGRRRRHRTAATTTDEELDDDTDGVDTDGDDLSRRGLLSSVPLSDDAGIGVVASDSGRRGGARGRADGVYRRCVALRARSVSFNFCLTCFGVVNALVVLFLVGAVLYMRDFTLPVVSGRLTVSGLRADAYVERDDNGVVHVRADNEHDLFFAQGFVSAQDRLFQIEFQRRLGAGRLSERIGNATISIDRYFRTLGLRRAAELAWPTLAQTTRDYVEAFVDGVNAFLASEPPLPIEFRLLEYTREDIEPFSPIDVVQWSKVMSYDLSMNMHDELMRFELAQNVSDERLATFFPDYDLGSFPTVVDGADLKVDLLAMHVAQTRAALANKHEKRQGRRRRGEPVQAAPAWQEQLRVRPASEAARVMLNATHGEPLAPPDVKRLEGLLKRFAGWRRHARASNNWAVHGQHTRSGRPLLANDPHLSFSMPAIWLLMHLQSPTINAIGAAFPSSPGVILGHNDYIAWGITNVGTDVQDLYVLDSVNQSTYRHDGELRAFAVRNETIYVKRPLLLKPYEIELQVRESVHGPVLSDHMAIKGANERDIALRWAALDPIDPSLNAFMGVMRAQNWTAFRDAMSQLATPASNVVYADVYGNIGYQTTGVVPVRVAGHDGRAPVSGNGSFDWLGYAPFATLPSVLNPQSGFVVSANNRVSPASFDSSLILNNADWSPGYRARRISEMLRQRRRLSVDDLKAMQMDRASGLFDDLTPLISGLLQTNLLSDREREWLTRLEHWNGVLNADSREGTVFLAWIEQLFDSARGELGSTHRPSILFVHRTFGRFVDGELPFDPVCLADLAPSMRTTNVPRVRTPTPAVAGNDTLLGSSTSTTTSATTAQTTSSNTTTVYTDACVRFAARAFSRGLQQLFDNWSEVVALGKRQQVVFEHEILKDTQLGCFFQRHSDIGGDPWTVNPSGGVLEGNVGSVREADHGASYRQIVDLSDFSQSLFMSTVGQGEQPMSPFFDIYLQRWLTGEYNPMMQQGVYASLHLVPGV